MQSKVEQTRIHETWHAMPPFEHPKDVPVAEAELVLIECKPEEAVIWRSLADKWIIYSFSSGIIKGMGKYLKPILISKTEKILKGDWYIEHWLDNPTLKQALEDMENTWAVKVLALPQHFSPKHLQAIVDGKLKDGDKILVEGEYKEIPCPDNVEGCEVFHQAMFIKLNSSNHITLHKIEEKMYTKYDVNLMLSHIIAHPKITAQEIKERVEKTLDWYKTK